MKQRRNTIQSIKNTKGFSLVEALLAIAVFGLVVSGVSSAFLYGQQSAAVAGQRERAVNVADDTIEAVRSIAAADWDAIESTTAATDYGLTLSEGVWTFDGTSSAQDIFTRKVVFADICRNAETGAQEACSGSNIDSQSRSVTVTVTWTGLFDVERTFSTATLLTNWGTSVFAQTDWSGGSGQSIWSDETQYDSDTGSPDVSTSGEAAGGSEAVIGCGVKQYPFTTAADYIYDDTKIQVTSDAASLVQQGSVPDADTKGLWHADELSGALIDSSGNGNNLTAFGSHLLYNQTSGTPFARAITSNDGADDYWYRTDATQTGLDFSGAFTLEAWYKTRGTSLNGPETLFQKWGGTAATNAYRLYLSGNGTGTVTFQMGNGTTTYTATSSTFTIVGPEWNHFAAVYDGGTSMKIYMNGVQVGSQTFSGTMVNSSSNFYIGGTGTNAFVGVIDEARVSSTARYASNFTVPTVPFGQYYPTDSPTIESTASYTPAEISRWEAFTETATKETTAEIYYQLSDDDGATWKYWNGSAWATATTSTHYNAASVVQTNIASFPTTNSQIRWKAFFVTNTADAITLDNLVNTCVLTQTYDYNSAASYTSSSESDVTFTGSAAELTESLGVATDANTKGLWHFDPLSGSVPDAMGVAGNAMSTRGTITYNQTGLFGRAMRVGSFDSALYVPTSTQVALAPTTNMTVDLWAKKSTFGVQRIVAKYTVGKGFKMMFTAAGKVTFEVTGASASTTVTSPNAVAADEWVHLAGEFQQTSGTTGVVRLYINGEMVASSVTTFGTIAYNNIAFEVGNTSTPSEALDGIIDELRLSNVARYQGSNFTPNTAPYGASYYPATSPTITPNTDLTLTTPNALYSFTATETNTFEGDVQYQVSTDSGVTWQYWNGSVWATAGASSYNTAEVVNTNIDSLSITDVTTIRVRAFLISGGGGAVSLGNVELAYTQDPEGTGEGGEGGGGSGEATITSSAFDMGKSTNITHVEWDEGDLPCDGVACSITLQLRTAPDNAGVPGTWTGWYGPDGENTFFEERTGVGSPPPDAIQGNQWLQYRITITNTSGTPVIREVRIFYD